MTEIVYEEKEESEGEALRNITEQRDQKEDVGW